MIVDDERAERIVEGAPRDRNEQEFAGYRDAVHGLMRLEEFEPLTVPFVLHLHRQMFAHSGGRGGIRLSSSARSSWTFSRFIPSLTETAGSRVC